MSKGERERDGTSVAADLQANRAPAQPVLRHACMSLLAAQTALMMIEWFNRTQGVLVWWPSDDMGRFISDLLLWPIRDPLHWAANFAIVLMLFWLLSAITGRMRLAIVLGTEFYVAMGIVNHLKMMHLGVPISTGDVSFAAFAVGFMLKSWGIPRWVALIPVVGIVALCAWCWRRRKPPSANVGRRAVWGTGSVAIALLLVLTLRSTAREGMALAREDAQTQSHLSRSQQIGLNLALAFDLIPEVGEPANPLSEREVDRFASAAAQRSTALPNSAPHVIFWLSESLWDPTLLPDVKIEPDPLANYRRLGHRGRAFNLLVPTFGGFTSRTMFEMATGLTNAHVPAGRDAFTDIVSKAPFPSLARLFASRGYDTMAAHAGMGDMFAAKDAYAMLGFARYDTDDDMPHAARARGYVSDQALSEYVVQRVEASPKPMFAFLASMQNHSPYEPGDYQQYHARVFDPTLNIVDGPMISYIEGVYQADQALGYLVRRFEHDGVPVVVVFYGDHLPGFVNEFAAAKFFPPCDPMSLEQLKRKFTTPALIWTNTPLHIPEMAPEVSPQAVVAATLRTLGIEHPFYTGMLGALLRESPAFGPYLTILPDGHLQQELPDTPAFRVYQRLERSVLQRHDVPKRLFPEGPG